jgi:hypothetical protein
LAVALVVGGVLAGLVPAVAAAASPVVVDDGYAILEDAGPAVLDVRSNDSDDDFDSLMITAVTQPADGTTSTDGLNVTYTPAADFNGIESFDYTIDDGNLGTATATVTVTVTSVNDAPSGTNTTISTPEDTPYTFAAADFGFTDPNDTPSDALQNVVITTLPGVGSLSDGGTPVSASQQIPVADIEAAKLVFAPGRDANGAGYASLTFQVRDDGGTAVGGVNLDSSANTITIDVSPVNDKPNAVNDASLTVPESAGARSLPVLANDTDVDGGTTLKISKVTQGGHGSVAITGGGTGLTYNPNQLYYGTDIFTYTVSDGLLTDSATVLMTVVKDTVKPAVTAPVEAFYGQIVGSSTMKARIAWSGTDTGGTGIAKYALQVSTNGGSYATVTLASATSLSTTRTLTDGRSYRIRIRATDKQGNVSAYVYGPTFKPGRAQNTSSSVHYTGTWVTSSNGSALGGSHRYATSAAARVTFSTTTRDIAWVATRTSTSGSAQVWIDGVLAATVNLHALATTYRQLVFARHFTTLGSHTIELRPAGGGRVYLDAFLVYY